MKQSLCILRLLRRMDTIGSGHFGSRIRWFQGLSLIVEPVKLSVLSEKHEVGPGTRCLLRHSIAQKQ